MVDMQPLPDERNIPIFRQFRVLIRDLMQLCLPIVSKNHTTFGIVGKGKLTQDIILKSLEFSNSNLTLVYSVMTDKPANNKFKNNTTTNKSRIINRKACKNVLNTYCNNKP